MGADWDVHDDIHINKEINVPITEAELVKAAILLKNNNSPGNDHILNEHIKVSKGAKIRSRYNQVPHLTQNTNRKVTNAQ